MRIDCPCAVLVGIHPLVAAEHIVRVADEGDDGQGMADAEQIGAGGRNRIHVPVFDRHRTHDRRRIDGNRCGVEGGGFGRRRTVGGVVNLLAFTCGQSQHKRLILNTAVLRELLIKQIASLPNIEIEGIFTHFATADEADKTKAYDQFKCYQNFVEKLEKETNIKIEMKHCSNSAGIVEMPEANLDAVRAGIILYGLWPSQEVKKDGRIELMPALSLKTRIVYVKMVPANQGISYGGTFITYRDTRVATVCIGYGDGYPRSLSNKGYVLVNGQRAPILGRVCMDQFMIDVTDIDGEVCVGNTVILIGNDGQESISMEDLGELSGRFNYELACDLGKRIPRIYKMDDTLIYE